jgi:hypothetical protein
MPLAAACRRPRNRRCGHRGPIGSWAYSISFGTKKTEANWMWLLINADQNPTTGWEGYDFIVNRTVENTNLTWLEENLGG